MKDEEERRAERLEDRAPAEEPAEDDRAGGNEEDSGDASLREMSREEIENELEMARAEIERLHDQSLRRQAELINFRRRVQKEQAETASLAQARLLEGLVPVIDDFERAVEAESADARAYHEGMRLILRSVQKVLERIGVERIEPRGERFDPRYHEAIARHETDDVPEGQVLDVYQPGYRLNERLIRPAAVVVAYGGGSAAEAARDEISATAGEGGPGEEDGGRDDG